MSAVIDQAVTALNAKLDGGFAGNAKFVIEDEGSILLDQSGARAGDGDAFMTGKLKVDGDMGQAMQLGAALS